MEIGLQLICVIHLLLIPPFLTLTPTTATENQRSSNVDRSYQQEFLRLLSARRKDSESALKSTNSSWSCPHINDIPSVSCMCDIPHTLRCRGQAKSPAVLKQLVSTLATLSKKSGRVSLLDLDIHGIRDLEDDVFTPLPLLGLIISSAGLVSLPENSFRNLEKSLTALGLPANRFISVPYESLQRLQNLQRLDLGENRITQLAPRAFPKLFQLRQLSIAGNSLDLLQEEAFVALPLLESLDLSHNQLDAAQINERTMRGLHRLKELSLNNNLMKGSLYSDYIGGVSSLTKLDLSHNAITSIKRGALHGCPLLVSLELSHNQIEVIEDHAFMNLSNLQVLSISHNHVVALSGLSLAHLSKLKELNLADNSLITVSADILHQLHQLTSLDLAANDISELQPHVFNYTPSLSNLSLADNPLHCDCSVLWFWKWLRSRVAAASKEAENIEARCATPPALDNVNLALLASFDTKCYEDRSEIYHDYYHDYLEHDAGEVDDIVYDSDGVATLMTAQWLDSSKVELVWKVSQNVIPYYCNSLHVYQISESNQTLADKIGVNCSSDSYEDPSQVIVEFPAQNLQPGFEYKYCLGLILHGAGVSRFTGACSEPVLLIEPISDKTEVNKVISLTGGDMHGNLVVQTRIGDIQEPCSYTLSVVSSHSVIATAQLNCSDVRYTFSSLEAGTYQACVLTHTSGATPLAESAKKYSTQQSKVNGELTEVSHVKPYTFANCTPVIELELNTVGSWSSSPLMLLLFTIPGMALFVTLYIISRKMWHWKGIPWRWDPRATKSAKYFLYTGETETPSASLDQLAPEPSETTTRV